MNATGASLLRNRSGSPYPLGGGSLTPVLSPLQSQVDSLVGGFAETATDWRSLAAMVAGGTAYRIGRAGLMAAGTGHVAAMPLRIASVGLGLTAEVSTFELTHRSLLSIRAGLKPAPTDPLWRWSGTGGIQQGLLQSFITFGTLKSTGRLASGENLVIRHLLQDSAMVTGHQISGLFGITPSPTGTLAEQFLHAEATNLQIGAGMALASRFAPGIHALERGLDLSLNGTHSEVDSRPRSQILSDLKEGGLAWAGAPRGGPRQNMAGASSSPLGGRGPLILAMSGSRGSTAISSWPPPAEEVPDTEIPGRKISGVMVRQGGETYPYVGLQEYRTQTLSLIRLGLSTEDVTKILEQQGRGGLSLEQATEAPHIRGLLLAEASNQGLALGIFPRSSRQWNMVQRLIESAYVHFDLEALRSYREGLSLEWWGQYRAFLNESPREDAVANRRVDVPLQRLDRPLPGEYILPRTDSLRDKFLRQVFLEGVRSPMENVLLLRDPRRLGALFAETFNNAFTPLMTIMGYLRRNAPEGEVAVLLNPRYEVEGVLASMRERVSGGLREIPEYVRILKGGQGSFHRDFIRSAFKEVDSDRIEVSYEEIRRFIEELPEDLRRELGTEPLPPLSEILSSNL